MGEPMLCYCGFFADGGLSPLKWDNTLYELGCREIELAIDIFFIIL